MANVNAAFGLVPVRHMSGNIPRANKYTITSDLGSAVGNCGIFKLNFICSKYNEFEIH